MKKIKRVLSLFDGMSTLQTALTELGYEFEYFASEIKPYAIKLTQYHYPKTVQLGDITKWKQWDIDWNFDFIGSGSPCQDLSAAGKRAGINGSKSSLFFTFVEILEHIKTINPNVLFLQENVGSASKLDVGIMSRALGVYPVRINSSLLTAQLRDRYYWTNIRTKETIFDVVSDIPQPKDKNIFLKDIIENRIVYKKKSSPILEKDARALQYKDDKSEKAQKYYKSRDNFEMYTFVKEVIQLNNSTESGGKQPYQQNRVYDINGLFPAICTTNNGFIQVKEVTKTGYILRKLSQIELERLQGFSDGHTSILSYNQSASLLGDGWTLPVIKHILSFID